jgi:hypothetical protein
MGNKQAVSVSFEEQRDPFTKDVRELFYVDERLERIGHSKRRVLSQDGRTTIDTFLTDQMRRELQEKPIKHVHYHSVRPITSEVEHR